MSKVKITIEIDGESKMICCDKFVLIEKNDSVRRYGRNAEGLDVHLNVFDEKELALMLFPLVKELNKGH